ncbi:MAG: MBL fold metallo-hydrolase [Chloroflexi bacterium]|nr:MBL fold metallo-hydrolase [Chloroflexota bacterium]
MTIEITYLTLGLAATNAYLVADTDTGNAILIDPVDQGDLLVKTATDRGWTIKLIVATHAHFDHVLASAHVKELTGAPFVIHAEAVQQLSSLAQQGLRFTGSAFPAAAEPDRLIGRDDEWIELDAIRLQTLFTPGHAPGHISLYMQPHQLVFSGDALFAGSIGRTDLPGGSMKVLMDSIFGRLIPLGDDVQVLPGHGEPTTIGHERQNNPFLLSWQQSQL